MLHTISYRKGPQMIKALRSAERIKFSHYRAKLMFDGHMQAIRRLEVPWSATIHEGTDRISGDLTETILVNPSPSGHGITLPNS